MEFYYKFVDKFQDLSKVKTPAVTARQMYKITWSFQKKIFLGVSCCNIDHALLESYS